MIQHPIPPLYDAHSSVLILGSFPSVKSREAAFFYGHPQNRFWKVLAQLFEAPVPDTVPEKKQLILSHHLALWDVIAACDIEGSADSTIRNVVPNDLSVILNSAPIQRIFVNGRKAESLYKKYLLPVTGRDAICLPSTSPANASWNLERLTDAWRIILQ